MNREDGQGDDLRKLAEEAMEEKTDEMGNERQARELWDVPAETSADLAAQQDRND